jgi:hypothetical protein
MLEGVTVACISGNSPDSLLAAFRFLQRLSVRAVCVVPTPTPTPTKTGTQTPSVTAAATPSQVRDESDGFETAGCGKVVREPAEQPQHS